MYALPALTFDSFTSRAANAPALDVARRVAEGRPDAPALLVLEGPSGAGKTHLLSAIGAARRARAGAAGTLVEYVSMGDLLNRLRVTATWGAGDAEAERYAAADLLLVDDAQRAAASPAATAALAAMLEGARAGRCVVIATAGPPADVAAADARLARLLAAATVCQVAPLVKARRPADGGDVPAAAVRATVPPSAAPVAASPVVEPLAAFADADESIGGAPPPAPPPAGVPRDDYANFLSDVVAAVSQHVEPWKQRLAEESNRWGAQGYGVRVLERALARTTPPDVDGLLATYAAAVEHLRRLEAQAVAIDGTRAGAAAFRDPERVADAEAALGALLAARGARPAAATPAVTAPAAAAPVRAAALPSGSAPAVGRVDPFFLDGEKVVWDWPDVGARVIEELR